MQHTPQCAGGGEAPHEALEDDAAIRMSTTTTTTTTTTNAITDTNDDDDDATKPSFGLRIRGFVDDSLRSRAVVVAFGVSVLISVSIGLTVGILPEMLTDRYARLYHGYGSEFEFDFDSSRGDGGDNDDAPPCWTFDRDSMPDACASGADDAQTGSAWATFVQNLLVFFFNAAIGSYSDVHGRKKLLSWSVVLNGLGPCALLGMQRLPGLDPAWYYASASATGAISYTALIFAALSDGCPEEYRAGRFATNLAGFYFGFAVAPTLALLLSHDAACVWSVVLGAAALPLAVFGLPETLPEEARGGEPEPSESMARTMARTRTRITTTTIDTNTNTTAPGRAPVTFCFGGEPRGSSAHLRSLLCGPLDEMAILNREPTLRLLSAASFLAAAVYSTDSSLVLFYIEDHLGVTERGIAGMFVVMGLLGAVLQGVGLQPLICALGERGLLVVSFASGTIHNLLYGLASSEGTVTVALSLSQVTKLGYPVLSSLCSQRVGPHEQGRVQGALLALNALGGAVGPVLLNRIYARTEGTHGGGGDDDGDGTGGSSGGAWLGPGTMFVVASGLYFLGTIVVVVISCRGRSSGSAADRDPRNGGSDETGPPEESSSSFFWEDGDPEEPLLLQLGETSTI